MDTTSRTPRPDELERVGRAFPAAETYTAIVADHRAWALSRARRLWWIDLAASYLERYGHDVRNGEDDRAAEAEAAAAEALAQAQHFPRNEPIAR